MYFSITILLLLVLQLKYPHLKSMQYFSYFSTDWFGFLQSWADSKKKSNLVLVTFPPGIQITWLGDLKRLGPSGEMNVNPYKLGQDEETEETPFPVPPSQRRSYNTQTNVAWIKPSGLQVHCCFIIITNCATHNTISTHLLALLCCLFTFYLAVILSITKCDLMIVLVVNCNITNFEINFIGKL